MTNKEKEEYISEILTIRSGLSLIYDNQCIVDEYFTKIKHFEEEINPLKSTKDYYEEEKKQIETKLKNYEAKLEKDNLDYKCIEKPKMLKKTMKKSRLILAIVFFLLFAGCLLFGLNAILSIFDFGRTPYLVYLLYPGFVFLILTTVNLCKLYDKHIAENKSRADNYNKKIDSLNYKIKDSKNVIKEEKMQLEKVSISLEKATEPYNRMLAQKKEYISNNLKNIQDLSGKNAILLKYLEDNHSKIFCKRDWAYIDLILFYLNTGRADSLKEALQLVDRQVQTNEIVNAISSLSSNLISIIADGIKFIGNKMDSNYLMLSTQLGSLSHSVNNNNMLLIKGSEIQQKLLDHANVSSEKMSKYLGDIESSNKKLIELDKEILSIEGKQLKAMGK